MAKTVVGLFDDLKELEAVVRDLIDAGATPAHISILRTGADVFAQNYASRPSGTTASGAAVGGPTGDAHGILSNAQHITLPGIGLAHVSGPIAKTLTGGSTHTMLQELKDRGVTDEDARFYAEGVRRGSTLVLLRVLDEDAEETADIMERHGAVDIASRATGWKSRGWSDFDTNARPLSRDEFTQERDFWKTVGSTDKNKEGETVLPVIEEELHVGKREVGRRGVRLVQEVRERPVEETIRLREERVRIERRPVDRAISVDRVDQMKDHSIELNESVEEAVVSKTARVKEEVVVHKDSTVREEKIKDTVKSTDVRVEETGTKNNPKR